MPPAMRPALLVLVTVFAAGAAACGDEIGDECSISSDCSSSGDRICDTSSPGGYCTVLGCDHDTCPSEATCVRFFAGAVSNLACDPATEDLETDDCTADELCTLRGACAPRTAESRFCMLTCGSDADCREGYECRDLALMEAHGGEPVLPPDQSTADAPSFCAPSPLSP
jgi:hypothetical protein